MKLFCLVCLCFSVFASFALTIYDVQYTIVPGANNTYPSLYNGQEVTVTGIVTGTGFAGYVDNYFIAMPGGGPWSGIYVYKANFFNTTNPVVVVGDEVEVTGYVAEYYGYTEISGNSNPVTVTLLSSGNPVPNPAVVQTSQLVDPADAEQYEGCFVEVQNVVVTSEQNNYGEWYVTDVSAVPCQVDDGFFYLNSVTPPIVITLGMEWAIIRGCLDYSYNEYAINPRTPDDLIDTVPLIADFSANPLIGPAPLQVTFTDESIGAIISWEWDFDNDGTIDSSEQNPIHIYNEAGIYTVTLTVGDGSSTATETKVDYIVVEQALSADFSADPLNGLVPLEVFFTDESSGAITSWEWDFDSDGTIDSNEQNPVHIFDEIGTYTVTLTISDGSTVLSETKEDYIVVEQNVIADFSANPLSGLAPLNVQFTNESWGEISEYAWDFDNDGTIDSNEENPSYTYETAGIYTVSLTVYDLSGNYSSTETKVDYIAVGESIIAFFTAFPLAGLAPLEVSFTDQSSGPITIWEWDFDNDGTIDSNEQNPQYIYLEGGLYSISLTVSDGTIFDSFTRIDYIEVSEVSIQNNTIPHITNVASNPNPFYLTSASGNSFTRITFNSSAKQADDLEVVIYNLKGQRIKTIPRESIYSSQINSNQVFGSADWDGRDETGRLMPTGVYCALIKAEGIQTSHKMLLLK
jgi:PKD repeat protein